MRAARLALMALAVGLTTPTIVTQPGCAALQRVEDSPRGLYFESQELFIVAVTNANQAKRAGRISQSDWDTAWLPAINEGNVLLDQMEAAYLDGDTETFNFARASLGAAIRLLEGTN